MTKLRNRVLIITLFAVTFMFIGWVSPMLFATYAPPDMIIDSHGFNAQNATVDSSEHYVCFDRTVHRPAVGETYTELYLVPEDSSSERRTKISTTVSDRYYQGGRSQVVMSLDLPNDVDTGKYRYLLVVEMELADGRVERPFTFVSDPFYVSEDGHINTTVDNVNCQ